MGIQRKNLTISSWLYFGRQLLVLALIFSTFSTTAETATTVTISTEADYPPFSDENLKLGGLFPAITKAVFENLGYQAKMVFLPFERALHSTEHLQALAVVGASKNASREEKFLYSMPIYTVRQVFYAHENLSTHLKEEQNFKGLKVCRPVGNNLKFIQTFLDAGTLQLVQPTTFKQCFEMLHLNRVQLVQVSFAAGQYVLNELPGKNSQIIALEFPLTSNSVHFIISRKHPEGAAWIEKINTSYQELSESGEIEKLVHQYF